MRNVTICTVIFVLLSSSWLKAEDYCFAEAEKHYNVDRRILYAISIVESQGNNTVTNANNNKSTDVGHMQLNSWWGFTPDELRDACFQTMAGAAILSDCFKRYKNGPDAIACYNTGKPLNALTLAKKEAAKRYVANVYEKILRVNSAHKHEVLR